MRFRPCLEPGGNSKSFGSETDRAEPHQLRLGKEPWNSRGASCPLAGTERDRMRDFRISPLAPEVRKRRPVVAFVLKPAETDVLPHPGSAPPVRRSGGWRQRQPPSCFWGAARAPIPRFSVSRCEGGLQPVDALAPLLRRLARLRDPEPRPRPLKLGRELFAAELLQLVVAARNPGPLAHSPILRPAIRLANPFRGRDKFRGDRGG